MNALKDKAIRFYRDNFAPIDFLVATALAVLALATIQWRGLNIEPDDRSEMYALVASISGTMLGFVITGMSIVLVIGELPPFQRLRDEGHYNAIFDIFFRSVGWLALTTIYCVVAFAFDKSDKWSWWWSLFLLFLLAQSAISFKQAVWVLRRMSRVAATRN